MKSQIASPVRLLGLRHENKKNRLSSLSKKLLLLTLLFIASNTFYGQTRAKEKVKTETRNEVNSSNNSKVKDAQETKAEAEKTKADAKAKADKASYVANDPKGAAKT